MIDKKIYLSKKELQMLDRRFNPKNAKKDNDTFSIREPCICDSYYYCFNCPFEEWLLKSDKNHYDEISKPCIQWLYQLLSPQKISDLLNLIYLKKDEIFWDDFDIEVRQIIRYLRKKAKKYLILK